MQMLTVDQLVGRTLGDYQVEQLLGHGQLSAVYMARQKAQGRIVMITTFNIPRTLSSQARARFSARFAQEGAALVALRHPHILPTYDFGEQADYPYLVTAFVKGASLAQALKQQVRFTPQQALGVLKQLADGLDYAHSHGVIHSILSSANILVTNELAVQIAGFGLRTVLEVQGGEGSGLPNAHLFSASGAFLGNPEYIAPERVQGLPVDARADIYALGIILFELLTGVKPFSGAHPLEAAMQRLLQPVPSVHGMCPGVPAALDLVMNKALERDPAGRYQRAGEIVRAFERVLNILEAAEQAPAARIQQAGFDTQLTLPPTVNWFDEEVIPTGKWQLVPPIITGRLAAVQATSPETGPEVCVPPAVQGAGSSLQRPPVLTDYVTATKPAHAAEHPPAQESLSAGVDPFAWWSATSQKTGTPTPGTFGGRSPVRLAGSNRRPRRQPSVEGRRRVVTLLATGGAVGILGAAGISFAHFVQSMKQAQIANVPTTTSTRPAHGNTPTAASTQGAQKTPTTTRTPTANKPSPSPTKAPQPTQPPQPTPPPHTGTVIGYTNQALNTSKGFTNPGDGNASLLIHLPGGNFVACEKACTHEGVPVYYDGNSHQLVCPAHGAIFDPANNFSVVQGPANTPLPGVSIRVNKDGTITTG